MSAFNSRTGGYKAGMFLLFFASFVFLVGLGAPYWYIEDIKALSSNIVINVKIRGGLWMTCTTACISIPSATGCTTLGLTGLPGWFLAVRAMEGVCTIGLIIACIYALATNCRSLPGPRSRVLEGLAGLSGILGYIGCMVHVSMIREGHSVSDLPISTSLFIPNTLESDLDWAFFPAASGSGLVVIAAIVIAINNKPLDVQPNTGGMVMTTATAQPQPYVVQPGHYPPQPYVAQPGVAPPPYSQISSS
ncbi:uncharacterized protein LOC143300862 [Babylonia areolata]|uniref:uncharacterized protein LOC143300862 n=1 Tax=Babylonia areolata TaxID=304850 RepID=UPI003FD19EDC